MSGQSTGIYRTQRAYFERAYETGRHGWPIVGVSPMVARFLRAEKGRGRRALDIGCGEGRHSVAFADAGFRTVGVDLEPKALARARGAADESGTSPLLLQASVFALPFRKSGGHYLLSCFSTKFKHHAGERRTRNWLVHAGHYDRFFRRADFPVVFGRWFDILALTEDRDGLYVFHNVLMRKKSGRMTNRHVRLVPDPGTRTGRRQGRSGSAR
jgi:SAM-dependent methyltransferase